MLVNGEGQYSSWPVFAKIPAGWTIARAAGSRQACLDHIESNWTDLHPKLRATALLRETRAVRHWIENPWTAPGGGRSRRCCPSARCCRWLSHNWRPRSDLELTWTGSAPKIELAQDRRRKSPLLSLVSHLTQASGVGPALERGLCNSDGREDRDTGEQQGTQHQQRCQRRRIKDHPGLITMRSPPRPPEHCTGSDRHKRSDSGLQTQRVAVSMRSKSDRNRCRQANRKVPDATCSRPAM